MVVVACRKTVWAYDAKTPLPISPPLANEDTSSSSNRRAPGQANSSLPSRLETSRSTASRGLKALACQSSAGPGGHRDTLGAVGRAGGLYREPTGGGRHFTQPPCRSGRLFGHAVRSGSGL